MAKTMQVDLQLKVDQAQTALKQLQQQAQQAFKSQGGNSQAYQQVAQQAAAQKVYYKDALSQQSAYNKSLQEEAAHRQQALNLAQKTAQQARLAQENARAQVAQQAASTIKGAIPGGNLIAGGIGGTAGLVGAAAIAGVITAVGAELSQLGDRARELATGFGAVGTKLGDLASSIERGKLAQDSLATNPVITGAQKGITDFKTDASSVLDGLFGGKLTDRLKQLGQDGLGGQAAQGWERLKTQRSDMETDIAVQRQGLDIDTFRKQRDYAITLRNFAIDTSRQQFDLQKQAQRQEQDYTIQKQKFDENFAGQQAAKQFAINQQFARQSYQISQSRATQDFGISQSDKSYDFNLSQSRNQTEFNINQSRAQTSRKNQLFDMAMGGANGLQFLQASRDFQLQQQYAQQDFQRNKQYQTQDFNVSVGRDTRNFGISQQRAGQDFGISQQQAQIGRQMELENMLYARKYEGLGLELQHNRALADINTSLERFNQDVARQSQALQNQGSDMNVDITRAYAANDLSNFRQRRGQGYAEADFAGNVRNQSPLMALGGAMNDPSFAAALAANASSTKQQDIFKQANDYFGSKGFGAGQAIPDLLGKLLGGKATVGDISGDAKSITDYFKNNPLTGWAANLFSGIGEKVSPAPVIQTGNKTYNITAGNGFDSMMQQIQAIVDEGDRKTQENILDLLRKNYGG